MCALRTRCFVPVIICCVCALHVLCVMFVLMLTRGLGLRWRQERGLKGEGTREQTAQQGPSHKARIPTCVPHSFVILKARAPRPISAPPVTTVVFMGPATGGAQAPRPPPAPHTGPGVRHCAGPVGTPMRHLHPPAGEERHPPPSVLAFKTVCLPQGAKGSSGSTSPSSTEVPESTENAPLFP